MIFDAFPASLRNDVDVVIQAIGPYLFSDNALEYNTHTARFPFIISENEQITVPYRLLLKDACESELSPTQKTIMHCIYSRSTDGYIREQHVNSLLQTDFPNWVFPYILKLSDEYVVEILEDIYCGLKDKNNSPLKDFCQINGTYFRYSHARMISYWNCFYRDQCYHYSDYIGKKLYHECFGYSKGIEK